MYKKYFKRGIDILFSLVVLSTIFPLFYLVLALPIRISSGGSVIYRQKRKGLKGKEFYCYKFRSMKVNSGEEGAVHNDSRVTKIGKFIRKYCIDEIPQFINVFIGDMSLIGPRPASLHDEETILSKIPGNEKRFEVRPGITGPSQVTIGLRLNNAAEKIVELACRYAEECSFLLDVKIFILTFRKIFSGKNI